MPENAQNDRRSLGFGNLYASSGDHIGHFYQTSQECRNVLVSFIKTGLEAREKCICLASTGGIHQELQDVRH